MTGPFRIDVERAAALLAGMHCPMPNHDTPRTVEVAVASKLTTEDKATGTAAFLGRQVPVRDMVVVRCDDDDCAWGREITALPGPGVEQVRMTYAGLGYVDVPLPTAGAE